MKVYKMERIVTATLDAGLFLSVLDKTGDAVVIEEILQWNLDGKIQAYVSNRIFDPDTWNMRVEQREEMRKIMEKYHVNILGLYSVLVFPVWMVLIN